MSGVTVEVSAKKVWFPFECPCCSGYPDTELRTRRAPVIIRRFIRRPARGITVPYCRRCVAHTERWAFSSRAAGAMTGAAFVTSLGIARNGALAVAAIACAVGVLGGLVVRAWQRRSASAHCKHSCVHADQAITCVRRSGHAGQFTFASRRYAAKFAIQNVRQLVNVDRELLALIEEYRTRGDSQQIPAAGSGQFNVEQPAPRELEWLTAKPRKRRRSWWQDSSISGTEPTQLSA